MFVINKDFYFNTKKGDSLFENHPVELLSRYSLCTLYIFNYSNPAEVWRVKIIIVFISASLSSLFISTASLNDLILA